jgi:hypothetical protein
MAFEQTKKSRMAIVAESTEGTPAFPSSGADFLAMQDGFSTEMGFETLENAELKSSIGKAKSISGFSIANASLSHYLRHNGVTEGVAPQSGYSKLLKAAYGSEEVNGTQYTTIAGSTTTAINVGVGVGANFAIGEGILIKHSAFAWELNVIKSIAGDVLTPLFALQNAPASGTGLGKAVSYRAADSGHPSLSLHDYRGNGGAYSLLAGMRVTSMSVEATAGELINASFELEGIKGHYNPIRIQAADAYIDFNETGPTLRAASVEVKVYRTPHELAAALAAAMNAVATDTITVTYSDSTGKFTIASSGALLELLWNTGANTANTIGDKIGFSTAADDTGAVTYTSDNAQDWSSPYTPSFDSPGDPLVAKDNEIYIGTTEDNVCAGASTLGYSMETPKVDALDVCEESGKAGSIISERTVSATATLNLPKHRADLFEAMAANTSISFMYAFGVKSGGNWVPGKCGILHIKEATVTTHTLGDNDGLVTLELEIAGHVDSSGNSETALNLL